jgi:sn-glycerol 3-phosphate transport system permease protein
MIFYANMVPFFVISVLVSVAYMVSVFRTIQRPVIVGIGVGAGIGLAGPMLTTGPLQSCTFAPEQAGIDFWFGVMLFAVGTGVALFASQWLIRFLWAPKDKALQLMEGQITSGVFASNFLVPVTLLAPTILILVVFLYYPLLETFRLSTMLVRLGAPRTAFRCVSNFTGFLEPSGFDLTALAMFAGVVVAVVAHQQLNQRAMSLAANLMIVAASYLGFVFFGRILEEDFALVMFNTFFIAFFTVVGGLVLGLAIAYLAYQPVKGAMIYRTLLIWPYAISPAISGIIFFVMFDPVSGIINHTIELMGGEGLAWLTNPWLARTTIIVASIWKTLGYNILFYIAGLQSVPKDTIEAAAIDGANPWQRFRHVVIPALSPITFFLIITNLTYAFFNIFGTIDFLTRGGPVGATAVSIYDIIQVGIRSRDLGRAAAQSMVLFLLVIIMTWFQFRTTGRKVTYGA